MARVSYRGFGRDVRGTGEGQGIRGVFAPGDWIVFSDGLFDTGLLGIVFVGVFLVLILFFTNLERKRPMTLRVIPAFSKLRHAIGLAVEAGKRLHFSLGRGTVMGLPAGSAFAGFGLLDRIARTASVSDRPPIATSGDGSLTILSQDTIHRALRAIGEEGRYDPSSGQLSGLTPFAYAAGNLPVIYDEQIAASILSGHYGSEVALITDAIERNEGMVLAGSDNIPAQAVLYATAEEPLIGEELYVAGAYLKAGTTHIASVRAQDVLRWGLVGIILVGAILKFLGLV